MATRQGQALGRIAWSRPPSSPLVRLVRSCRSRSRSISRSCTTGCNDPDNAIFAGWSNFYYFVTDPFFSRICSTPSRWSLVLVITVVGGVLLAMLLDRPFWGQGIVRVLVISPFFIMPTVWRLVWKNLMMHPVYGFFACICRAASG